MKTPQFETQIFPPVTRSRLLLGSPSGHLLFAFLFLILVVMITIAAATGGNDLFTGANLMLLPGQPGIEPAFY
jgi:hypothetical protein